MTVELHVQNASDSGAVPTADDFRAWAAQVLAGKDSVSVSIRVVNADEMQALNGQYRGMDNPTNVLSFPASIPPEILEQLDRTPLGDIAICAQVVEAEALAQGKPPANHWAHLTVHGLLHLLGHDHQDEEEAKTMESLERKYLADLGIPDPYAHPLSI